jgi:hypothetical protein
MHALTRATGLALLSIALASPISLIQSATAHAQTSHAIPRCTTADVRVSIGGQNAGVGSIFTTIVVRNISHHTCTIAGHPGVSLVDSQHRQIGRPASWDAGVIRLITLRPGDAASTMVRSLNPGVGTNKCLPPSAALRIYIPNERTSVLVPARLSECLGTLNVKPFVPGTNG